MMRRVLYSPWVRRDNDRIATGPFLLYYLGLGYDAQSGCYSPVPFDAGMMHREVPLPFTVPASYARTLGYTRAF